MNKTVKKIVVNFIAITLIVSSLHYYVNDTKTVEASDEYVVVWEDNFDGNSLDRSIWNYDTGNGDWGWGNGEKEYYTNRTENVEVSNGTLKIKGLRENYGGQQYTSGRINTRDKAEFRYGIIEARMRLPSFTGAWPAFWMLGGNHSEIGWPRCGEIDIMESINTEKFSHGALHWYGEGQKDSASDSSSVVPADFDRTQWHTYGMEWTEKTIKFMVDGKVFFTQNITDGYMGEFRKEQFIILNLAIGGQWPGYNINDSAFPRESVMEVDYVRVSQRETDANIIKGSGVTDVSPIVIPEETETRNVIEYRGPWNIFYNTAVVSGTGSSTDSKGYTANIAYLGSKGRLITASIKGIDYIPGNTYDYSLTLLSDIDKYVNIKAVGEDQEEDVFGNYTVFLQAGYPYKFSEKVTIDREYDGRLDLIIEMGGRIGGEYLPTNTSLTIKMTDASFTGVAEKLKEIPTQKPTTIVPTTTIQHPTTVDTPTTIQSPTTILSPTTSSTEKVTTGKKDNEVTSKTTVEKPARVVIKKAKNIKKKKIKITWKKVKGAKKYQVRAASGKKTIKKTTKKLNYTLIKLKKNKTYKISVRAYNSAGYGKWSRVKKIKVKK